MEEIRENKGSPEKNRFPTSQLVFFPSTNAELLPWHCGKSKAYASTSKYDSLINHNILDF